MLCPGSSRPVLGSTEKSWLVSTLSSCLSTSSSRPDSAQYSGSRCMSTGNWNALRGAGPSHILHTTDSTWTSTCHNAYYMYMYIITIYTSSSVRRGIASSSKDFKGIGPRYKREITTCTCTYSTHICLRGAPPSTHQSAGTSPLFSSRSCSSLTPLLLSVAAPKSKPAVADVLTGTLRRKL